MVLLDNDSFLKKAMLMFGEVKNTTSKIRLSMKKFLWQKKTSKNNEHTKNKDDCNLLPHKNPLLMYRIKKGRKKISTLVSKENSVNFISSLSICLKSGTDKNLRKNKKAQVVAQKAQKSTSRIV